MKMTIVIPPKPFFLPQWMLEKSNDICALVRPQTPPLEPSFGDIWSEWRIGSDFAVLFPLDDNVAGALYDFQRGDDDEKQLFVETSGCIEDDRFSNWLVCVLWRCDGDIELYEDLDPFTDYIAIENIRYEQEIGLYTKVNEFLKQSKL